MLTEEMNYSSDLEIKMHQTIKKVSSDFENLASITFSFTVSCASSNPTAMVAFTFPLTCTRTSAFVVMGSNRSRIRTMAGFLF